MARHRISTGKKRKVSGPKKTTRRRRRVGATGQIESVVLNGGAVGVGAVAAAEGANLLGALVPSLMASPMLTGAIQFAGGGLTAYVSKNGLVRFVGLGAMGMGVYTVLKGAGIIGAVPQQLSYQFVNRRMMGDPRLKFVAGPTTRIGSSGPFPVVAGNAYPDNFPMVAGHRKRRYSS